MSSTIHNSREQVAPSKTAPDEQSRYSDAALTPPVDVIEDESGITLYADLPGDRALRSAAETRVAAAQANVFHCKLTHFQYGRTSFFVRCAAYEGLLAHSPAGQASAESRCFQPHEQDGTR